MWRIHLESLVTPLSTLDVPFTLGPGSVQPREQPQAP